MALTVKDLIAQLQGCDEDMEVHFTYNYGDHWRTQVAPVVRYVEEGFVEESSYHQMDRVVEDCYDDEGDRNTDVRRVILIS